MQVYDKNPSVGGTWYENRYVREHCPIDFYARWLLVLLMCECADSRWFPLLARLRV